MEPQASSYDDVTSRYVRSAVAGDRASLEWVVSRLSPLLLAQARYRLGRHLQDVYEPEDLVNDVWAIALPRLESIVPRDGRMTPVLVRFVSRALLNRYNALLTRHIRREHLGGRERPIQSESRDHLDMIPGATLDLIDESVRSETVKRVLAALDALDEVDRAVVVLRAIEQSSTSDVGHLLGLKPNTVAVRYRRLLERLKSSLPGSVFAGLEVDDSIS